MQLVPQILKLLTHNLQPLRCEVGLVWANALAAGSAAAAAAAAAATVGQSCPAHLHAADGSIAELAVAELAVAELAVAQAFASELTAAASSAADLNAVQLFVAVDLSVAQSRRVVCNSLDWLKSSADRQQLGHAGGPLLQADMPKVPHPWPPPGKALLFAHFNRALFQFDQTVQFSFSDVL